MFEFSIASTLKQENPWNGCFSGRWPKNQTRKNKFRGSRKSNDDISVVLRRTKVKNLATFLSSWIRSKPSLGKDWITQVLHTWRSENFYDGFLKFLVFSSNYKYIDFSNNLCNKMLTRQFCLIQVRYITPSWSARVYFGRVNFNFLALNHISQVHV